METNANARTDFQCTCGRSHAGQCRRGGSHLRPKDRSKQVQCEGMPNGRRCLYEAGHRGKCNDVRQSPPPRHFVQEPKPRTHFAF